MSSSTRRLFTVAAMCTMMALCCFVASLRLEAAPRSATEGIAVLVVTRSSVKPVVVQSEGVVEHLLDLRWREGYTTATLPVLVYDFDRAEEQKYCREKLGVAGASLPFVGIVSLQSDFVPGRVVEKVSSLSTPAATAAQAFERMRALRPSVHARHSVLPRGDLAEMLYRLFLDLSPAAMGAGGTAFSDVPPTHPDAAAISFTASQGLVRGFPDGTFRPSKVVTRYELALTLSRALDRIQAAGGAVPTVDGRFRTTFRDVPASAPARPAVEQLCACGVMSGFPDGTFGGHRAATVAETHAAMGRLRQEGHKIRPAR